MIKSDFVEKVQGIGKNIDTIIDLNNKIDEIGIDKLKDISNMDIDVLSRSIASSKYIMGMKDQVTCLNDNMDKIRKVYEINEDITEVADQEDNINDIGDAIDDIEEIANNIDIIKSALSIKPMVDELVSMRELMISTLGMRADIDEFNRAVHRQEVVLNEINDIYENVKSDMTKTSEMMHSLAILDKRVDEKVKLVSNKLDQMREFSIKVEHLKSNEKPYSAYDAEKNILELGIPQGKTGPKGNYKGDKGDPGRNGKDFSPSYKGPISQRKRFDNFPAGISFLSLDEIPTMIYFKKSDALADWTEGQPFGTCNGEDMKITIENAEKVGGYTVDQIVSFIEQKVKEMIYGRTR